MIHICTAPANYWKHTFMSSEGVLRSITERLKSHLTHSIHQSNREVRLKHHLAGGSASWIPDGMPPSRKQAVQSTVILISKSCWIRLSQPGRPLSGENHRVPMEAGYGSKLGCQWTGSWTHKAFCWGSNDVDHTHLKELSTAMGSNLETVLLVVSRHSTTTFRIVGK